MHRLRKILAIFSGIDVQVSVHLHSMLHQLRVKLQVFHSQQVKNNSLIPVKQLFLFYPSAGKCSCWKTEFE